MFNDSSVFARSEMEVRTDRIRNGIPGRRRAQVRGPRVRRPAEASESAR